MCRVDIESIDSAQMGNIAYNCDTHYPWIDEGIIAGGKMSFLEGALTPPTDPGLGVDLDQLALERLHQLFLESGIDDRDDTATMHRDIPGYERRVPRW